MKTYKIKGEQDKEGKEGKEAKGKEDREIPTPVAGPSHENGYTGVRVPCCKALKAAAQK